MKFPGIVVGQTHTIYRTVGAEDTMGSYWDTSTGELLSTPGLVAIMMDAARELVDKRLPEGFITLGKRADVTHEHPSVQGANVRLTVEISEFDGYHVTLSMEAYDESGLIATGSHVRTIVNERWMRLKVQRRMAHGLTGFVAVH